MPAAYPAMLNFNAGELSPRLAGRTDVSKYNNGCSLLENFIPLVQGPARRRSGTRFVKEVAHSAKPTFLTRFVFSATQAYILEWGDFYLRFYTDHGALLEPLFPINVASKANPVEVTVATPHGYATGDTVYIDNCVGMTEINGQFFQITVTATDRFTLNGIDGRMFGVYSGGGNVGRVYTVSTPYPADGLSVNGIFQLNIEQSGDVAYVCHASGRYPVIKLSRLGNTNWTFTPMFPLGGPFKDMDPNQTINVYASAVTGLGITITADTPIFDAGLINALMILEAKKIRAVPTWEVGKQVVAGQLYRVGFRVYKAVTSGFTGSITPIHTEGQAMDGTGTTTYGANPQVTGVNWEFEDPSFGWVQIISITDAQHAIANVISPLDSETVGAGNATTKWAFSAWSDNEGYPTTVKFFRTRLCFARGQQMWMSEAADFEKFRARDEGGEVTAEMAISITIPSQDPIRWIQEGNLLLVGTSGAEHLVGEITTTEALGPANIQSKQVLSFGGRGIPALRIADTILFIQLAGHKLREVKYSFQVDGYISTDATVLADHIAGTGFGFLAMAWQQEPHNILWLVRADGQLVGFTYNREQDVLGFHRHIIGGGIVESIACIPAPTGDRDELWMVVRRNVQGVDRRYVEFLEADWGPENAIWNAFFVDSGQSYFGPSTTDIGGLNHLIGMTVDVLVDGSTHPQVTVDGNGHIQLQRAGTIIQVGLPCPAKLHTMRLEAGAGSGTAQSKMKRITNVTIRVENMIGGRFGSPLNQEEFHMRIPSNLMNQPNPTWTGDWPPGDEYGIPYPEGYEMDAIICYENDQPVPATIVAFYPALDTQDG